MNDFITTYNDEILQRIITSCNVSPAHNTNISTEQPNVRADALWDTGATRSVIDPIVVKKLKLKPVGDRIIQTANGNVNTLLYKVNLIFDNGVRFNNIMVAATPLPSTQVIVGMDIISQGDLAITNGSKHTTFSFQTPATRSIDFGKEQT